MIISLEAVALNLLICVVSGGKRFRAIAMPLTGPDPNCNRRCLLKSPAAGRGFQKARSKLLPFDQPRAIYTISNKISGGFFPVRPVKIAIYDHCSAREVTPCSV